MLASEQNPASAVQSGRKAPLKKETEENQKEQAVSQQICENGATPTGGQARRRNGPASMAASYLNIADFLAKQDGEARWRRRAGFAFPKICLQ